MNRKIILILILIFTLFAYGCKKNIVDNEKENLEENITIENDEETTKEEEIAKTEETAEEIGEETEEENDKEPEIDIMEIKPDESGEVMVIMYHTLGKNSDYGRSVESFKQDIQRLYDMGFRTVSLKDFVNNDIDIEAGYTPVVLTFDDGHKTNFFVEEIDGEIKIDPDCVVGILENFYNEHPEFGLEATFFLNGGTPFGQKDYVSYKLNYLLEKGMDIGNHSYGHEHLKDLSGESIEKTLGRNVKELNEIIPEYEVNLLALPFGERPNDEREQYIISGEFEGIKYNNIAVLKVGWKPEVSAINKKFNFKSINRVQSGDNKFQLTYYLDQYEKNPRKRFISDGNSNIITVPLDKAELIDEEKIGDKELRTY